MAAADFAVPANTPLPVLVDELAEMLTSPDPVQRDQLAYSTLATWIDREVLPAEQLDALGDEMARRFAADQIQVRTFAPLILDSIVSKGRFDRGWFDAFAQWYPAETDLRGYDEKLGWLHAIAHGADLLGAFGLREEIRPEELLGVASQRLIAPATEVWRDHEHDRLGYAIALILTRDSLTAGTATGWLDTIADNWANRVPGAPPAEVSNVVHTLRMVFLLCETGVRPSGAKVPVRLSQEAAVRSRLLTVLHSMTSYMW